MTKNNPIIKFSHDWNGKLKDRIFTTMRVDKDDHSKHDYYEKMKGVIFSVHLNGIEVCKAVLIDVDIMEFVTIPNSILFTDTGIDNRIECYDLFKKFGMKTIYDWVVILTFRRGEI